MGKNTKEASSPVTPLQRVLVVRQVTGHQRNLPGMVAPKLTVATYDIPADAKPLSEKTLTFLTQPDAETVAEALEEMAKAQS